MRRVRTGCPWRDLPARFGKWNSVFQRFRRLAKRGVFQRVSDALSDDPDFEYVFVDGTIVQAPRKASVIRGGKTTTFTWVTDLPLDRRTVRAVMRCARRRWAIENETFKTLKSGDMYSFERTCGHGNNHLRDVFGALAMPAFPVDQIRRHCRGLFGRAQRHRERSLYLRDDPGDLVRGVAFPDRETLYRALAGEVGFVPVRDGP